MSDFERIDAALRPGERVLWLGQPDPEAYFQLHGAARVRLAQPFVIAGGAFIALSVFGGVFELISLSVALLACVLGGLILGAGLWSRRSGLNVRQQAQAVEYAITDQRVLVCQGNQIESRSAEDLNRVERFGAQASFVFPGLTLLAIATPDEAEASLERLRKLQALSA